jgi:hypothetical protein
MATGIATIGGIALAPGVSRNGRLYTKQAIAGMVARAQDRITSPDGLPITMLTHHAAGDDSTRIVGQVTKMTLDESGNARYSAEIAGTPHGRTIADLAKPPEGGGRAFLPGVSIRAAWADGARVARMADGSTVETGDDLELNGLDFTHKPGVVAAGIDTFAWTDGGTRTETSDRVLITESVEEALVAPITEGTTPAGEQSCAELGHTCCKAGTSESVGAAFRAIVPEPVHVLRDGSCTTCTETTEAATPMGKRGSGTTGTGGPYADPGYQADKKQRYQLDTKAHAKAAWSYISQAGNAKAYSAAQLKRVKGRIMKALKGFGVTVATESASGWSFDNPVAIDGALSECYDTACDPQQSGSWSISASNGAVNLNLSAYRTDPAELDVILQAAAKGACAALAALDPDMDGDIDVDGAPNADSDDDAGESEDDPPAEETGAAPVAASPAQTPAPVTAAGSTTERTESAMPETTTPAAETTTAAPALTKADVDAAVASALAADREARRARKAAKRVPAETAPAVAAAVAETAPAAAPAVAAPPAVTETEEQKIARMVGEKLAEQFPTETADERFTRLVQENFDAEIAKRVQSGQIDIGRKGVVRGANETAQGSGLTDKGVPADWPQKPLHEYSPDEMERYANPVLVGHYLGSKAAQIQ